ncbi:MAG: flavodoxin family protein [Bacteroidota bacterium]
MQNNQPDFSNAGDFIILQSKPSYMKAVLFNGSPRKQGNTFLMLTAVSEILEKEGIETEIIQVGGKMFRGCLACYKCYETKNNRCIQDDDLNMYYDKMLHADAVIIGSPTYVGDLTPETKAMIDRCCLLNRANGGPLRRKIGAAVTPVRRAGSIHVFDSINHFFLIGEMIVPGSVYWNMSLARNIGEYHNDEEGVKTMTKLGENIAWLLKKIK